MRRSRKRRSRAGHYDTKISIYQQSVSAIANTDGEIPESAQRIAMRWAEVIPLRGRLRDLPGTQEANVTHVVRCRRDSVTKTFSPDNWIVVNGTNQRLNIVGAIDLDNRRRDIELECTERLT